MMVPVFYDVERQRTKVWAFLGWEQTRLEVDYGTNPEVVSCERVAPPDPAAPEGNRAWVRFRRRWCQAATPVLAQAYVERPMDRDEFRRYCDRHHTHEQILANLR